MTTPARTAQEAAVSTETDTVELAVPDAAVAALHEAGDEPLMEYVRAIARPVVAAELRRLAGEDEAAIDRLRWTASLYSSGLPAYLQPAFDRHHASMMRLRARADELDPS